MHDEPSRLKIEVLTVPVATAGYPMEVTGVSLSRGGNREYRAGLLFRPSEGPADLALHVFLRVADAAFLRDALDEVLKAFRARQTDSN